MNGGHIYREISYFGSFNNWQKIVTIVELQQPKS